MINPLTGYRFGHDSWRMAAANLSFLAAIVTLAIGFGHMGAAAAVAAAPMNATQMIEANLPGNKSLGRATRGDVLAAISSAIKKSKNQSAEIVNAAITAHKNYSVDVISAAIDALGARPDCALVGRMVDSAVAANPEEASGILEAGLRGAPRCRGEIQQAGSGQRAGSAGNYANAPINQTSSASSIPSGGGGGGGNSGSAPGRGRVPICHNGHTIVIPPKAAAKHLRQHPGDTAGACNPTPTTNT